MPVYRVYYATEETQRQFTAHDYTTIYGVNRIEAYRSAFELFPSVVKWGAIVETDPTPQPAVIAPNLPQIATPDRVQVQWWHNATLHAGERFGQFSQDTYEVLSQDEKWTAIRFHGNRHVVATSRTRSESAAA